MTITKKQAQYFGRVLLFLVGLSAPAGAQTRQIDRGHASQGKFAFYWETHLDPPTPPFSTGFGTAYANTPAGLVHRVLLDRVKKVYFGYSVQIEPLPEGRTYRLTFQPLSLTPELNQQLIGNDAVGWTRLPAPRFPSPRTVHSGEVLELNLLTNAGWGQTLTEFVTVQAQEPARAEGFQVQRAPREFTFAGGTPRDFRAEDVDLRLREPRVSINGHVDESSLKTIGDEAGPIVWIYVPNRGRFLLSLIPRPELGFRRTGEIRGSSLRFTVGGDTFSIASGSRVAPGQSAFNLYVLHQPTWRPAYANANLDAFAIGSADRAEYLVGR